MTIDPKKRNELFLIGGLLLLILLLYVGNKMVFGKSAITAEVSVEGQVIGTFPLNKSLDLMIDGYQGGTNHLVIKDGGASVTEASCPDKVCVRQGIAKEAGQALVCLPNKVIITIR